jgi:hypothetical protein
MQDWINVVKEECFETVQMFFVSFFGTIPYMGYAKNRVALMIVIKCFIHRPAKKMAQDVTI